VDVFKVIVLIEGGSPILYLPFYLFLVVVGLYFRFIGLGFYFCPEFSVLVSICPEFSVLVSICPEFSVLVSICPEFSVLVSISALSSRCCL
jgi:hypothetical protein